MTPVVLAHRCAALERGKRGGLGFTVEEIARVLRVLLGPGRIRLERFFERIRQLVRERSRRRLRLEAG
jgi:hypothetical protein